MKAKEYEVAFEKFGDETRKRCYVKYNATGPGDAIEQAKAEYGDICIIHAVSIEDMLK